MTGNNAWNYENFDVRIERDGELYRARTSAETIGEATALIDLSEPLAQLKGFLFDVGQARRRSRGSAAEKVLSAKKFGAMLFDGVFQADTLVCLQRSLASAVDRNLGTRIRLRLTDVPELSDLPWEFLFDKAQNSFLSLSKYTPIVRYLDLLEKIRPLDVVPPLRVLVIIASPDGWPRLDVEQEWNTLLETLSSLMERGLVEVIRMEKPQFALLPRALKRPFHILHFIGHGDFDNDGGSLVFEDERHRGVQVPAEMLGTVMHDHRSLRLVVLNSCEGARASRIDPFTGTAQTLLRRGIPAVLAMQFEITDEAAITVTSEFYASVAAGDPIDTALTDARRKLFAQYANDVEWATPVLYLRSLNGKIFDLDESQHNWDTSAPKNREDNERRETHCAVEQQRQKDADAAARLQKQQEDDREAEVQRQRKAERAADLQRQREVDRAAELERKQEAARVAELQRQQKEEQAAAERREQEARELERKKPTKAEIHRYERKVAWHEGSTRKIVIFVFGVGLIAASVKIAEATGAPLAYEVPIGVVVFLLLGWLFDTIFVHWLDW